MGELSVNNLKRGMIIDSDVFSKRGSLLLYKGFKIENPDLVSIVLRRNGISNVLIREEEILDYSFVKESDRISQRIKQEVTVFKEEFNKIVETLEEDIENFVKTKDINKIRDLDSGIKLANKSEKTILTLFQMVEKIKNDGSNEYSDVLQISLIAYSIAKWIDFTEEQLVELSEVALLSGVFLLGDITFENKDDILGKERVSEEVLNAAFYTRERNDGSGPAKLMGDEIPLYSKIIAIAEIFYSLTNQNEVYEQTSVFDALKIMQLEYVTLLDPRLLYVFLHKVANKYIGSTVRLSDGTSGVIVFVPENEVVLPFIKTSDGRVINLQNEQYRNNKIVEIV